MTNTFRTHGLYRRRQSSAGFQARASRHASTKKAQRERCAFVSLGACTLRYSVWTYCYFAKSAALTSRRPGSRYSRRANSLTQLKIALMDVFPIAWRPPIVQHGPWPKPTNIYAKRAGKLVIWRRVGGARGE